MELFSPTFTIPVGFGVAGLLYLEQRAFFERYPAVPATTLKSFGAGVAFVLFLRSIPTMAWVVLGDAAPRPEWIGPPP